MEQYTTPQGVRIAVDQLYTDVYRDRARLIVVVGIGEPRTDSSGRVSCEVAYQVLMREGVRVARPRTQTMDAARLTDSRLYQRVEGVQA
ncbi:hypothetical protein [Nocardia cyriacigeorgica]|uniref:hypothetical protein n=1 Tax=Nocardia cyriacigeorgica TaxID=135487 RepID=UPI001895D98C|nr:hypothetical protein [Nocardia cyriacigeorgica]MBF6163000.1 hypothetical protein [Nocardia cyriacigeorgica]MBF6201979.1 hypothetical protein [Nocardia cyriacigeorgica]